MTLRTTVLSAALAVCAPAFAQTNIDTTTGIAGSSAEAAKARADADARSRAEANSRADRDRRESESAINRVRGSSGIGSSVSGEASGGTNRNPPANVVGSGSVGFSSGIGVGVGGTGAGSSNSAGIGASSGLGSPK